MDATYTVTDHTRGHAVRSSDLALIASLQMLWLMWGHVVTLTRLSDAVSQPSSATLLVPRG